VGSERSVTEARRILHDGRILRLVVEETRLPADGDPAAPRTDAPPCRRARRAGVAVRIGRAEGPERWAARPWPRGRAAGATAPTVQGWAPQSAWPT
jgi:hypothetical protein